MSGFFDRLIARHLESAPVRPRVASRFEARRGGLPPDPREQQVTIAASPVWAAPARTAPSAPRDEGALDAAGEALDQSVPREPRTGRLEPTVRAPRRWPEGMGTPMRPSVGDPVDPDADGPDDMAAPARLLTVRPATLVPRDGPAAVLSDAARAGAPETAGRSPASVQPQIAARRSLPVAPPALDVVHVHIGRVEVRAVMAPAERPRAPQSKTPAALPLDRYLSGDGRR
jgi:hypothetical protein